MGYVVRNPSQILVSPDMSISYRKTSHRDVQRTSVSSTSILFEADIHSGYQTVRSCFQSVLSHFLSTTKHTFYQSQFQSSVDARRDCSHSCHSPPRFGTVRRPPCPRWPSFCLSSFEIMPTAVSVCQVVLCLLALPPAAMRSDVKEIFR
jgi:hypothetical protein